MQDERSVRDTLHIVFAAMIEEGYDPIKQFSGFILSEDPTYIPVTNGARNLVRELQRDEMLSAFIKYYFEQK
ncbi:MAG: IreB family regulatory phosphoprotein [Clostridia bacterium]|nr:IreB family regulatory phosphoprotein [Clostridia bacterium]MBO7250613.1 IreB family regulatory phosphoprotein [Clostridia bacterium]